MRRRYSHFLTSPTKVTRPTRVIALACQPKPLDYAVQGPSGASAVYSWGAHWLHTKNDTYQWMGKLAGSSPDSWWETLRAIADKPVTVWIIAYHALELMGLLGFWEKLEHGEIAWEREEETECRPDQAAVRAVRQTDSDQQRLLVPATVLRVFAKDTGCVVLQNPPTVVRFRMRGVPGRITWLDLRNWGVEQDRPSADLATQCDRIATWFVDADLLRDYYDLGAWQTTAASQAMHSFRRTYKGDAIYASCHREAYQLESGAYYGGRCECYRVGASGCAVYHFDFRSMYPGCMLDHEYPVRLHSVGDCQLPDGELQEQEGKARIADVTITTPEPAYPLRRGDLIIFPIGTFRTTLCEPELMDALHRGRIEEVHRVASYDASPCLRGFAEAMHSMRVAAESNGSNMLASWAKRTAVALCGKLGQRNRGWMNRPDLHAHAPYAVWWGRQDPGSTGRYRSLAWRVQQEMDLGVHPDSVPAIAATITSWGRMRLLKAIRIAGWENVLYVDTDSLFVTEAGKARLYAAGEVHVRQAGRLQKIGGPERMHIYGVKRYDYGGVHKEAGLPREYVEDCGDGVHYWYTIPASIDVRQGRAPGPKRVLCKYKTITPYLHGVVESDGTVTPHKLSGG